MRSESLSNLIPDLAMLGYKTPGNGGGGGGGGGDLPAPQPDSVLITSPENKVQWSQELPASVIPVDDETIVVTSTLLPYRNSIDTGATPFFVLQFENNNDQYLVVTNSNDSSFTAYKFIDGDWTILGSATSVGTAPSYATYYEIDSVGYLSVACYSSSNVYTFSFEDDVFTSSGSPVSVGTNPYGIEFYEISGGGPDQGFYLTTSNFTSGNITTLKWSGSAWVFFSTVTTASGGYGLVYFKRDDQNYLAVCCSSSNNIKILNWDYNLYAEGWYVQSTITGLSLPRNIVHFLVGADEFLTVTDYGSDSIKTLKYAPGWTLSGSSPTGDGPNFLTYYVNENENNLSVTNLSDNNFKTYIFNTTNWNDKNIDVSTDDSPNGICSYFLNGGIMISVACGFSTKINNFQYVPNLSLKPVESGKFYANLTGDLAALTPVSLDDILDFSMKSTQNQIAMRNASEWSAVNFNAGASENVTASASGTTVLNYTSAGNQKLTGTLNQIYTLPVVSTLTPGHSFLFYNASLGQLTANSSGGNLVKKLQANTWGRAIYNGTSGTDESSWDFQIFSNNMNGYVSSITPATPTTIANLIYALNSTCGGYLSYTISASDGTDFQSVSGYLTFALVNKSGALTSSIQGIVESKALSDGTISSIFSFNGSLLQVSITSSLTLTSLSITYNVVSQSNQAILLP